MWTGRNGHPLRHLKYSDRLAWSAISGTSIPRKTLLNAEAGVIGRPPASFTQEFETRFTRRGASESAEIGLAFFGKRGNRFLGCTVRHHFAEHRRLFVYSILRCGAVTGLQKALGFDNRAERLGS